MSACNHLASEITLVKKQIAPIVPASWEVDILWTARVAQICSEQILNTIGGYQGEHLGDLTVTELLNLVAWVESLRESLQLAFQKRDDESVSAGSTNSRDRQRHVDTKIANDALEQARKMLWRVHDLSKDEFLLRTKVQTDEWLDNVYV